MVLPDYEITEEERDQVIEKWARKIVGKGLETPAILFLEMHKPLTFLASQGLLVGSQHGTMRTPCPVRLTIRL